MHRTTTLALTALATSLLFQPSLLAANRRDRTKEEVRALRPKLVEMRRDFHMHPELSGREERTARVIAGHLQKIGIPMETGVAKYGVVATIKGGRPGRTVAFRADFDALPITETNDVPYKSLEVGVKHACGHDAHTTIALGAAEILWRHRDTLPGTVVIVFQPCEEGAPPGEECGASVMIAEGLMDRIRPDAMFGLHSMPSNEVGTASFTPGAEMASTDRFTITVTGKQTHGAAPHLGIDPIVTASQIVLSLQTIDSRRIDPLEPVVVSVGSFQAGNRFNIIPDRAVLQGTIRTLSSAVRDESRKLVESIAVKTAAAADATASVTFDIPHPVLVNDAALTQWAEGSLAKSLGASSVRRDPPRMIAEDYARFAELVPSFYFFLGVGNRSKGITAALHTPDFDIDEDALTVGTEVVVNLLTDWLEDSKSPGR